MKLDYIKFHKSIMKKRNYLGLTDRQLENKKIVSRSTIWRISKQKPIQLNTFLKLCDWLEKDVSDYIIIPKRPKYIENRLSNINNN